MDSNRSLRMKIKTQGGKVITKDGKVSCECCDCLSSSGQLTSVKHLTLSREEANRLYYEASQIQINVSLAWEGRTDFSDPSINFWVPYEISGNSSFAISQPFNPKLFCFPRSYIGQYRETDPYLQGIEFVGSFFMANIYNSEQEFESSPRAQKLTTIPPAYDVIVNTQFSFAKIGTYGSIVGGFKDSFNANFSGEGISSFEESATINYLSKSQVLPVKINFTTERTRNISFSLELTIT
jgi:hypothetical protein